SPPTKGQIYGFSMNRKTKSGGSVSRGIKAMTKYRTFRRMRAPPARYYEAKGGTISLRRKKSKNSCAQRRKGNQMPEKTIRQHKLGISIRDDLPDVPTVPESIRNELSLYMPTVLKEMMWRLGKSDTSYAELHFHVEHEGWCAQVTGSGKCNCNPVLRDYNLGT